jgi:hypothetical protein
MLCFIVCFVSLPGPVEIFEWSDAWRRGWRRGFVDSLSHRQRTSIPFFGECWRLDWLVLGVIHGTEKQCFALLGALYMAPAILKAVKHNRMSFAYHVDDIKNHILTIPCLKFIAEFRRN